jgi:uncharacterized protein involved in response to NO
MRATAASPLLTLPPQLWHGHEMLFGFIIAAIAGFLLTAVPSWTGIRGFAGWPLIVLSLIWLLGRVAFLFAYSLPIGLVAVAELAFLPVLAVLVAWPLLRARNRNTPLLLVLGALWFIDATFMCSIALSDIQLARQMLLVGIDVVLLLITVIGGRIVPAFTANALRKLAVPGEVRSRRWLDIATIISMVLLVAIDAFAPVQNAVVIVTALAAGLHAARLIGWQGMRTLESPIVWVLHLGYAWLPVGLALRAIHAATGLDWAADWLHALTAGAAATMIVAVITRASLGHTGRQLVVARSVAYAYGLLAAAALLRAFATALGDLREVAIWGAGALWVLAFGMILFVYAPILLRPRADGRPG